MKAMFGGNEAMMLNIDTARLSDEAFRHRFVDIEENRFWIAENLPAVFFFLICKTFIIDADT